MYQLLLVDDERHIVDWLYNLFADRPNLDVHKAYSGMEAVSWLNRTRIDLVLSDIRMPKMDGIELMKIIFQSWPKCRIIFLTGYAEFDYVYEAIKHPRVSYLLKTEDDDVIVNAVANAIREIGNESETADLAAQNANMLALLKQGELVLKIARGDLHAGEIGPPQLRESQISLDFDRPIFLMLGRIDNLQRSLQNVSYYDLVNKINLTMKYYLSYKVKLVQASYNDSRLIWLLQPTENAQADAGATNCLKLVEETLEPIQHNCEKSLGITLSFLIGNRFLAWEEIGANFTRMDMELEPCFGNRAGTILSQNSIPHQKMKQFNEKAQNPLQEKSRQELLESYLVAGDSEKFRSALGEIVADLNACTSMRSARAAELYFSVALMLLSKINRNGLVDTVRSKVGLHKLMNTDEFSSWKEASQYLFTVSDLIFALQKSEKEAHDTTLIARIHRYIGAHLDGDLSLVKLAEQFNYNPSYLSRIYKETTGTNLYATINKARLEAARSLIGGKNSNIGAAARATGFESPQYFATVFKKAYGMTPTEYRVLHVLTDDEKAAHPEQAVPGA